MSTLRKKPPLRRDWTLANQQKRDKRCRVCDKAVWEVELIELAHIIGCTHDLKSVSEVELDDGRGLIQVGGGNP